MPRKQGIKNGQEIAHQSPPNQVDLRQILTKIFTPGRSQIPLEDALPRLEMELQPATKYLNKIVALSTRHNELDEACEQIRKTLASAQIQFNGIVKSTGVETSQSRGVRSSLNLAERGLRNYSQSINLKSDLIQKLLRDFTSDGRAGAGRPASGDCIDVIRVWFWLCVAKVGPARQKEENREIASEIMQALRPNDGRTTFGTSKTNIKESYTTFKKRVFPQLYTLSTFQNHLQAEPFGHEQASALGNGIGSLCLEPEEAKALFTVYADVEKMDQLQRSQIIKRHWPEPTAASSLEDNGNVVPSNRTGKRLHESRMQSLS